MQFSRCLGAGVLLLGLVASCSKPPPPSVVLVPPAEKDGHFEAVNRHLQLGGSLYGYVDVDGDADKVADLTQTALAQLLKTFPGLEQASKIQLRPIFHALGFDELKALGVSSVAESNGEFRNRAFLYTPDGRHGVMAVVGGPPGTVHHLSLAPADADIFEELEFDVPALTAAIKQVIIAVKGKAAAAEMQQKFEAGGAMAGVSPTGLVHALKGRVTVVLRIDPEKTITIPGPNPMVIPRFALLLGVDGLAPPLKALLDKSPFLGAKEENGRQYYVPKIPLMLDGIRPVLAIDGSDLYLGTDEYFTHECLNRAAGAGLELNADFRRLLAELGPQVNDVAYLTPRLLAQLKRIPALNPAMNPAAQQALTISLGSLAVPSRPLMTVTQNLPDGMLVNSRLNRSFKPALLGLAIYNPVTISLAVALQQSQAKAAGGVANAAAPAAPPRPLPKLTPDERVLRNLALLKALSDAYYRRTGTETATLDDLVGPGKLLPRIVPAEGEDYSTVHFEKGQPLEVKVGDGRTLRYTPVRR